MAYKIFITGGGGFVGGAIVEEIVRRGDDVVALVHRQAVPDRGGRVVSVRGGLFDAPLTEAMRGCSAVVHLVGIIAEKGDATFAKIHMEGTKTVVEAAKKAGLRRFVQMSALGVRPDAISEYQRSKFAAEQIVRNSGLEWTILRPSMIHGPHGEFMQWVAAWARGRKAPFLFMPYFGKGWLGLGRKALIQPVFVGDVARAFVDCLEKTQTVGQIYSLGGPETMIWPEFYRRCAKAIRGRTKPALPVPAWYAEMLTRILPAKLLPFNWDQVVMSQEDNIGDVRRFVADFGWRPGSLEATLAGYAEQL
jgi:NADH dehydrogenase